MLASLLYPYDDDAAKRIDGWLQELEAEQCIVRYQVAGSSYLEVRNWLNHQKIDKPSKSKIPPFDEASRIVANPREASSGDLDLDLDQRIEGSKDQSEGGATAPSPPSKKTRATRIPDEWTLTPDLVAYAEAQLPNVDAVKLAEAFTDYWRAAAGEKARKADWNACWRTWVRRSGDRYPVKRQAVAAARQIRYDANGREIIG
jgi:hypothetical protein